MKYKYHKFSSNRSIVDAEKIFSQRIEDSTYIFNKHKNDFKQRDCPVCESSIYKNISFFHNMYGIDKCDTCNSFFVNPAPSMDALSDYYENCLCNRQLSKVIKERYDKNDFINDDRVQLIINLIKENLNSKKIIKILEVGCNNGAFLSKLRQALESKYSNIEFKLHGVDIDPISVKNSVDEELNLFHGFAEEIATEHKDEYDIIIHFELIEHLINPKGFVASIHNMLNSRGKMVFTTPNILGLDNQALDCNNIRYLAHALFPPMHINAFSTRNISHFLISNNFAIEDISTPGKFDIDMVTQCVDYLENTLFSDIALLDEETKALLQQLLVQLDVSSHMQCIASKINIK